MHIVYLFFNIHKIKLLVTQFHTQNFNTLDILYSHIKLLNIYMYIERTENERI